MRKRINSTDKRTLGFGRLFKFVVCLVLIGVSGLLFVNSARSIMTAYNRSLLLEQAEREVDSLRLENLELVETKEETMDESYVEGEARDRISYVKDGEVIVVLPETGEEIVLGEEDEINGEERLDGWHRWWDLMRNGV